MFVFSSAIAPRCMGAQGSCVTLPIMPVGAQRPRTSLAGEVDNADSVATGEAVR